MSEPTAQPRWFCPTPGWLVLGLLALEGLILVSEQWFPFSVRGWIVLIEVLGVMILLMPLWFAAGLIFRWRFQFSIRSVLLLTVTVAIPCSWLAAKKQQVKRQKEVAEAIHELGGHVEWSRPSPSWPDWCWKLLGEEFFEGRHIDEVILRRNDGSVLEKIKGLKQLRTLLLWNAQLTDVEIEDIKGLSHLQQLNLSTTQLTDTGLEHLNGLHQLTRLALCETRITDGGLGHLKALGELEVLNLQDTRITDAGLEHLRELSRLRVLTLDGTRVTDAGLEALKGLNRLQELSLVGTPVTVTGVEKLQQALPTCRIHP